MQCCLSLLLWGFTEEQSTQNAAVRSAPAPWNEALRVASESGQTDCVSSSVVGRRLPTGNWTWECQVSGVPCHSSVEEYDLMGSLLPGHPLYSRWGSFHRWVVWGGAFGIQHLNPVEMLRLQYCALLPRGNHGFVKFWLIGAWIISSPFLWYLSRS